VSSVVKTHKKKTTTKKVSKSFLKREEEVHIIKWERRGINRCG